MAKFSTPAVELYSKAGIFFLVYDKTFKIVCKGPALLGPLCMYVHLLSGLHGLMINYVLTYVRVGSSRFHSVNDKRSYTLWPKAYENLSMNYKEFDCIPGHTAISQWIFLTFRGVLEWKFCKPFQFREIAWWFYMGER